MAIYYPDELTDKRWKIQETKLGISNTGLGARLRNLEKTAKTFDAACEQYLARGDSKGTMDAAPLAVFKKVHAAHLRAIEGCWWVCRENLKKTQGKNAKAHHFFEEFEDSLELYQKLWTGLKFDDNRGLKHVVKVLDDRIYSKRADFTYPATLP